MKPLILSPGIGDNRPTATLYYGQDVRKTLQSLDEASVHTVCTSPPYWGLRDYGTGDKQIGLEESPQEFVESLVEVFREIKRVLRPDGTLWLNLGDSYAGGGRAGKNPEYHANHKMFGKKTDPKDAGKFGVPKAVPQGLKAKDLVGIPWRVAFALQADGWYLRSAAPWIKGNCMPESCTDRPTTATEYIFLFAHPDSGGKYFYDIDVVRVGEGRNRRNTDHWNEMLEVSAQELLAAQNNYGIVHNAEGDPLAFKVNPKPYSGAHFAVWPPELVRPMIRAGSSEEGCCSGCGSPTSCSCSEGGRFQKGDFEIIATPTGKRTAADPTMKTGRRGMNRPRGDNEGVAPTTRYEQRKYAAQLKASPHRKEMEKEAGGSTTFSHYTRTDKSGSRPIPPDLLNGWVKKGWLKRVEPPKRVPLPTMPCTVLDPFSGSATTGMVALQEGRNYIGIDLNAEYLELARARIEGKRAPKAMDPMEADAPSVFDMFEGE